MEIEERREGEEEGEERAERAEESVDESELPKLIFEFRKGWGSRGYEFKFANEQPLPSAGHYEKCVVKIRLASSRTRMTDWDIRDNLRICLSSGIYEPVLVAVVDGLEWRTYDYASDDIDMLSYGDVVQKLPRRLFGFRFRNPRPTYRRATTIKVVDAIVNNDNSIKYRIQQGRLVIMKIDDDILPPNICAMPMKAREFFNHELTSSDSYIIDKFLGQRINDNLTRAVNTDSSVFALAYAGSELGIASSDHIDSPILNVDKGWYLLAHPYPSSSGAD